MSDDDIKPGRASVSIETDVPVERAFAALVEPAQLVEWFARPSAPLSAGGNARLDFEDGDFFDVSDVEIDAPERLAYAWRFLGIGARNDITWEVRRVGARTVITVNDDQPERSAAGVASMCEGWRDFTDRLRRHLATGANTRYDWRRDVDAGIDLGVTPEAAARLLFAENALGEWLPWQATSAAPGARLRMRDGETPAHLTLAEVDRPSPLELRYVVTAAEWERPTRCHLLLEPRAGGATLTVSHTGWEGIAPRDATQRAQRERFCRRWIESLMWARTQAGAP